MASGTDTKATQTVANYLLLTEKDVEFKCPDGMNAQLMEFLSWENAIFLNLKLDGNIYRGCLIETIDSFAPVKIIPPPEYSRSHDVKPQKKHNEKGQKKNVYDRENYPKGYIDPRNTVESRLRFGRDKRISGYCANTDVKNLAFCSKKGSSFTTNKRHKKSDYTECAENSASNEEFSHLPQSERENSEDDTISETSISNENSPSSCPVFKIPYSPRNDTDTPITNTHKDEKNSVSCYTSYLPESQLQCSSRSNEGTQTRIRHSKKKNSALSDTFYSSESKLQCSLRSNEGTPIRIRHSKKQRDSSSSDTSFESQLQRSSRSNEGKRTRIRHSKKKSLALSDASYSSESKLQCSSRSNEDTPTRIRHSKKKSSALSDASYSFESKLQCSSRSNEGTPTRIKHSKKKSSASSDTSSESQLQCSSRSNEGTPTRIKHSKKESSALTDTSYLLESELQHSSRSNESTPIKIRHGKKEISALSDTSYSPESKLQRSSGSNEEIQVTPNNTDIESTTSGESPYHQLSEPDLIFSPREKEMQLTIDGTDIVALGETFAPHHWPETDLKIFSPRNYIETRCKDNDSAVRSSLSSQISRNQLRELNLPLSPRKSKMIQYAIDCSDVEFATSNKTPQWSETKLEYSPRNVDVAQCISEDNKLHTSEDFHSQCPESKLRSSSRTKEMQSIKNYMKNILNEDFHHSPELKVQYNPRNKDELQCFDLLENVTVGKVAFHQSKIQSITRKCEETDVNQNTDGEDSVLREYTSYQLSGLDLISSLRENEEIHFMVNKTDVESAALGESSALHQRAEADIITFSPRNYTEILRKNNDDAVQSSLSSQISRNLSREVNLPLSLRTNEKVQKVDVTECVSEDNKLPFSEASVTQCPESELRSSQKKKKYNL